MNCTQIIKYINLNKNYNKNIVNFVEFYKKESNEIRFR